MLRQRRGFTLIELMTVVAVIGITLVYFAINGATFIDQARFSSTVRTFHNSLNDARIKAVGNQATVLLVPRPIDAPANEVAWATGTNYAVGTTVTREGLSYRCIQTHTSDADRNNPVNQPIRGASWRTFWDLPRVYVWYNSRFILIRDIWALNPPGDPGNADPFNEVNPINIQFNARGFTADFVDHSFVIGRNPASNMKAGDPGVSFLISPLGRILQTAAP
jgi:prepilin-type N-terminal cleavage/methylation domain-containing protein